MNHEARRFRSGSRRSPLLTLAYLAFGQVAAGLLADVIHEVVGHGLIAEVLGGDLVLVFLSPIRAWAYTVDPDWGTELVWAGGVLAGFLVGIPTLWWLRRGRAEGLAGPARTFAWFFATVTMVGGFAYMSGEPLVRRLSGGDATGDWDRVYQALGVPPVVPVLLFGAAMTWCAARLLEIAVPLQRVYSRSGRPSDPFFAFWKLWAPGFLLTLAYAAIFWRWAGPGERHGMLGVLIVPVAASLVGRAWVAVEARLGRGAVAIPLPTGTTPSGRHVAAVSAPVALLVVCFGPVESMQRGMLIGPPSADRYDLAAQSLTISALAEPGGALRLTLATAPRRREGPPIRRRLTRILGATGPSGTAAETITRFIARWNLDDATVLHVGAVTRVEGAWTWSAQVAVGPEPMIRLWPLTMFADSRIERFELAGLAGLAAAESFTERGTVSPSGNAIMWSRGDGFEGIDSLRVRPGA